MTIDMVFKRPLVQASEVNITEFSKQNESSREQSLDSYLSPRPKNPQQKDHS